MEQFVQMGELAYRDRDTGQSWRMTRLPKVGDQVTYGKYAGQRIVVQNVRFLLLNDDEITTILPDEVEVTCIHLKEVIMAEVNDVMQEIQGEIDDKKKELEIEVVENQPPKQESKG